MKQSNLRGDGKRTMEQIFKFYIDVIEDTIEKQTSDVT